MRRGGPPLIGGFENVRMYVFTDLDDTLFQTRRKCRLPDSALDTAPDVALHAALDAAPNTAADMTPDSVPAAAPEAESGGKQGAALRVGGVSRSGEPLSFLLPHQQALFDLLDAHARIIPVTARNRDAFSRVRLPFRHGAVLNYGGTILTPEGGPDSAWDARMRPLLEDARPFLEAALARMREIMAREGLDCAARLVCDEDSGLPFYALAKQPQGRVGELRALGDALEQEFLPGRAGRLHRNDNNLAVIPDALNKAHAVRRFIDTRIRPLGEAYMTLGMGDSLEDLAFMQVCDYSLVPQRTQIAALRLRG